MPPTNVLVLWTDQQRADTIGAVGTPGIRTPHLDRLANSGALFRAAYCAQPVCSPARASLLTGLYPHTHSVTRNSVSLPAQATTLAEMLRPEGYACGYTGKWHLGREHCAQRGFEDFWSSTENYAFGYRPDDPDPKALSNYEQSLLARGYLRPAAGGTVPQIGRPAAADMPEEAGKPAFQAAECIRFLEQFKDRPFLLMCNFLEPHPPVHGPSDGTYRPEEMMLPETWYGDIDETVPLRYRLRRDDRRTFAEHYSQLKRDDEWGWKELKARYWGLCSLVDKYVGVILDRLEALGLAENTIVVYSSDHGDMMGEHRMLNKGLPYDGASKIPLLMRVPGLARQRIETPVSHVDVVPTLLDLLGQPRPAALQGQSLAPLLLQGDVARGKPEQVIVEWNGSSGFPTDFSDIPDPRRRLMDVRTIRRNRWKLNVHLSGEHELYDLEADPSEQRNRAHAREHRTLIEDLYGRLGTWQRQTGDGLALPDPLEDLRAVAS